MLSGDRNQEIQIPPEKKSKYPKVVGSLSAEVLFHVGARARNATVSQIPRQLNATTAPLGYWNALSKYKYKYKLICSRHYLTKSYTERMKDDDIDVTFVEDDYDDKMRTGGCNYLVNRAECSGSDNHTADLSTGSVFYIR